MTRMGPAAITMAIFGVIAFALGLVGLIQPEATLAILDFDLVPRASRTPEDYTLTFLTASSMAAVNVGAYYVLAAWTGLRPFYVWTVPFRVLTFVVFTLAVIRGIAPAGFLGVAVWELVGAAATGWALARETRREAAGRG
jgi:hypothetical protein